MRKILLLLCCLSFFVADAQRSGINWPGGFYINGPTSINAGKDVWPPASAAIKIGKDSSSLGAILPRVVHGAIVTTERGVFFYDFGDSTLHHMDGSVDVRYMTYKDTNLVKTLIQKYAPGGGGGGSYFAGYGLNLNSATFKVDSNVMAPRYALYNTKDSLVGWINGLFTAYYKATHIDSLFNNYYNKAASDARYLQIETDPTVPPAVKAITGTQIGNWDAAYGWGNHASAGYAKNADTGVTIATEYERKRDSLLADANNKLKLDKADTATVLNNYNRALEKLGAGRNAKIYTCILRPTIDVGTGNITWRFLGWSDDHDTLHAASITVNGTYLQVNLDTTCRRVLTCIATPDDDMGAAGVTIGCKGNLDNIQIYGSAPRGEWAGYFTWTGGTFTPEYSIQDIVFDTSVSPTYSFKITNPTPVNPNYGNGLSYTSNYSGQNYSRWSVQYIGNHGYTVSRLNDHFNPTFTVLDAAGNKVPNTAFTSTDLFMIHTGMDRRFPMSWNYNVNGFITSNSNIWLFAMLETY